MFSYRLSHTNGWDNDESKVICHEKEYLEKEFIGFIAQILYEHRNDETNTDIDTIAKYLVEEYGFSYLEEDIKKIDISAILPLAKQQAPSYSDIRWDQEIIPNIDE